MAQEAARRRSTSRLEIVARALAATVGAYVVSYALAAALSRWLPMVRSEAVVLTSNLAFVSMVVIAMWAFSCRSVTKFWVGISGSTLFGLALAFGVPR